MPAIMTIIINELIRDQTSCVSDVSHDCDYNHNYNHLKKIQYKPSTSALPRLRMFFDLLCPG